MRIFYLISKELDFENDVRIMHARGRYNAADNLNIIFIFDEPVRRVHVCNESRLTLLILVSSAIFLDRIHISRNIMKNNAAHTHPWILLRKTESNR